jgi:hypothetical protein
VCDAEPMRELLEVGNLVVLLVVGALFVRNYRTLRQLRREIASAREELRIERARRMARRDV